MSLEFEERDSSHKQVYRSLGQGLKVLHDHENAEVDILAVPGLGTNPTECWTWKGSVTTSGRRAQFNWIKDPNGLAKLFPRSRIMLYDYASAWMGAMKVRATMKGICKWLLDDLKEKRKGGHEVMRPLIFIGHSMGGIVVAKTLCMARAKKEFEAIVTCTMGCAFFGAPFGGSDMAKIALLYSSVFNDRAYEALLQFMNAEKNDVLDEVTEDFMEISTKLVPPIDLVCAYEQVATEVSYAEKVTSILPALLQHKTFKAATSRLLGGGLHAMGASTHFVEKESAILPGSHIIELTAGHSDLIKFESISSPKFVPVKIALSKMVQAAQMNVRRRTVHLGQKLLTQRYVNQVRQSLIGVDMRLKFRSRTKQQHVSSWLTSLETYQQWSSIGIAHALDHPYLWLKGAAGLGKTNACLAAIQHIEKGCLDLQQMDAASDLNQNFLAYFLCDKSSGSCTAEDVLKNLIIQLISQEESLAQHAKWFVPIPRHRGTSSEDLDSVYHVASDSGAMATATVDNLWKCFYDMTEDPIVSSAHIIINNIHCLETGESTSMLLNKLRDHACLLHSLPPSERRVRLLLTSRNDRQISDYLGTSQITLIDMENDHEYGTEVKRARELHAKDAVGHLQASKKYSPSLAYIVSNAISRRSEDEKWTDVLCSVLGALPAHSSDLIVKKRVNELYPMTVNHLVNYAWTEIQLNNKDSFLEIEEILLTLTIAYEPPTLADLAVLAQIDDQQSLTDLIRKCFPVIQVGPWNEHSDRVVFTSTEFKDHLITLLYGRSDQDPATPRMRQHHGLVALRCFQHIQSFFDLTSTSEISLSRHASIRGFVGTGTSVTDTHRAIDFANGEAELDATLKDASKDAALMCFYPTKYLFKHLSEADPDAAQMLYKIDEHFWGLESDLRDRWLQDFQQLTPDLKDLSVAGMSALHVAAGIGASEVVSTLLHRVGAEALAWTDNDGMTALHIAAHNNHTEVVDTLLRAGADIEYGEGGTGTALHFAAKGGHCLVMNTLISANANVNAFSEKYGPVINAAILSGTVDAVRQIMTSDVRFDFDYTKCDPPISLSAGISEPSLFRGILETGKEKWLMNAKLLDQALVRAAYGGNLESLQILLNFEHTYTGNTVEDAIAKGAQEKNWLSVNELLVYAIKEIDAARGKHMRMDAAFYLAAVSREERIDILQKMWSFTEGAIARDILDFALYQATVLKKNATVTWLLETCKASASASGQCPASVDMVSENTSTIDFGNPLNAAASTGNVELVKLLIQSGAEINCDRGYSLQIAAGEGHKEIVEVLLLNGAQVNQEMAHDQELSFHSVTALQAACDNNQKAVVQVLLANGADPNLGGGPFTNPMTAATSRADPEVLHMLLKTPAIQVDVPGGSDMSTPLINAAAHMATEDVELLIRQGATINARNTNGDTALIMAALKSKDKCVEMLCDQGADMTLRSRRHGLAIEAAAEGSSAACAQLLADKMGGSIEDYRERVKNDYERTQKALAKAQFDLEEREKKIHGLEIDLDEARDRLDTAHQQMEEHENEKQTLLSRRDLEGSVYEAKDQQIKAIKDERDNLQKQLDSQIGQYKMATDRADDFRKRLHQEREKNDALRSRQGWSALQEEKKTADEALEAEKAASLKMSEKARMERDEILGHSQKLQEELDSMRVELLSSQNAKKAAVAISEKEKHEKAQLMHEKLQLQEEVDRLKKDRQRIQEISASVSNEPDRNTEQTGMLELEPDEAQFPHSTLVSIAIDPEEVRTSSVMSVPQSPPLPPSGPLPAREVYIGATMGNPGRSAVNSPSALPDRPSVGPRHYTVSPGSEWGSSASPPWGPAVPSYMAHPTTTSGFKTIHGHHRPDGSLGRYPEGRGLRRKQSDAYDSLYDNSIRGKVGSDSAPSEVGSTTGSGELVEAEEARVTQAQVKQERRSTFLRKFSSKQS